MPSITQWLWDASGSVTSLYLRFLFCKRRGMLWILGTAASAARSTLASSAFELARQSPCLLSLRLPVSRESNDRPQRVK